jgi:REP element-mobilizing transposase RayT
MLGIPSQRDDMSVANQKRVLPIPEGWYVKLMKCQKILGKTPGKMEEKTFSAWCFSQGFHRLGAEVCQKNKLMGNTYTNNYTQIHIQFVFAVKFRKALIRNEWKEELHKYITGIVQNKKHKMLAINTMPDHLHMFMGFRPDNNISDLVQLVKIQSSNWINDHHNVSREFEWQGSFGAFSYSKSHENAVINYILNQEEHHRKITFLEEYIKILESCGVEYDPRYIVKDLID